MIAIIILIALSGIFLGLQDHEMFQRGYKTTDAWKNKYRQPLEAAPNTLYYRLFDLTYREKFLFSATALSFLSDRWHGYKFASAVCWRAAVAVVAADTWLEGGLWFVGITALHALGFHIFYTWIQPKKR